MRTGRFRFAAVPGNYARRSRTLARRGQVGLTLIEMIITIALLAVGIVGITSGIAATERIATINQDQAQLEVAMRQLSDFVRDSSSTTGLGYQWCAQVTSPVSATSAGASTYTSKLPPKPSRVTQWGFSAIYESTAGTVQGSPTPFISNTGCLAGTADWGVQEIKLMIFDGTRSLARTVWKSYAWCYQRAVQQPC
jgi:prepilin-type N-terminal cleavage/methylation domain-containing protein